MVLALPRFIETLSHNARSRRGRIVALPLMVIWCERFSSDCVEEAKVMSYGVKSDELPAWSIRKAMLLLDVASWSGGEDVESDAGGLFLDILDREAEPSNHIIAAPTGVGTSWLKS